MSHGWAPTQRPWHLTLAALTISAMCIGAARPCLAVRYVFVDERQNGVAGVSGINLAGAVTVSPDGVHVYAAGDDIAIFSRDASTGALTFLGSSGSLQDYARRMVMSADGRHLYALGSTLAGESTLEVFSRESATGQLTSVEAHDSIAVPGMEGAIGGLAISPGDEHVYVTGSVANSLVVFSRNTTTGGLTEVETHTDGLGGVDGLRHPRSVVVSPDGAHVYVGTGLDEPTAFFSRNATTGRLTFLGVVDGPRVGTAIAISPDGAHLYAESVVDGLTVFSRDSGTGAITFIQAAGGTPFAADLEVTPDGEHVLDTGLYLVSFSRNAATGELAREDLHDLSFGDDGAVSPDSEHVYVAGLDVSGPEPQGTVSALRKAAVSCSPVAMEGCFAPAEAKKAKLTINDNVFPDSRDRLVWKWLKGAALTLDDFGDPATTFNDYALCLYSSAGGAVLEAELLAPAAAGCREPSDTAEEPAAFSCWNPLSTVGFKYRPGERQAHGVRSVKLLAGAATQSKVLVKAKGEAVPLPALPLTLPVTVQLQNANGACWEAVYGTATVNDGVTFKALAD